MNKETWVVIDVNPERWAVGPLGVARKNGKMFPTYGRNQELHEYKQAVREALGEQKMLTGKVKVTFYFWRNMAEYETHQARTARKHEVDVTNVQKATEDALQGIFFENDKDVADIRSVMVSQSPETIPAIIICIEPYTLPSVEKLPEHVFQKLRDIQNGTIKRELETSSNVWNGPSS